MSRYLHTYVCIAVSDHVAEAKADSMNIAYQPELNIRRTCIDLALVDHYTEAESDIDGDKHPTTIVQFQSSERVPLLMKYDDFRAKVDAYRGELKREQDAIIYQLDVNTLKPV